jgi:hypothetical protein
MKNLIMICIVAAFATSCKKDYTCVCTTVDSTGGVTQTTVDTYKAKTSKKDADEWCAAIPKSTIEVTGSPSSTANSGMTCKIN